MYQKGDKMRRVTEVYQVNSGRWYLSYRLSDSIMSHICTVESFKRWMRGAEVLEYAE